MDEFLATLNPEHEELQLLECKKGNHNISFDGESSDGKTGYFSCPYCGLEEIDERK